MGRKLITGVNDLKSVNPELAAEWNYEKNGKLLPEMISANSGQKVWWKGKCGHEWNAIIANRNKGRGCPICSGKQALVGFNDLATVNPELAFEWHPTKNGNLNPTDVMSNSNKIVWWLGNCGHEWQAKIEDRNKGFGCPYCSGHRVLRGFNDLATVNPELAFEWHPTKNGNLNPIDVTSNSNKKVWWKGKCGHEWEASVIGRTRERGCPICSGRRVLKGYNDFASKNPDLASEWNYEKNNGLKPSDVTVWSHKKVWWLGKCGHEWQAFIINRVRGNGCPFCGGKSSIQGVNDLETLNPKLASEWNYEKNGELKPSDVMSNSGRKVWWKGKCGHEWNAIIASRNKGNGCPYCAGQKVLKGFNDLLTKRPDLASEWHPTKNGNLKPEDITSSSGQKVWWKGKCGHEWKASVTDRNRGNGCPVCNESHLENAVRDKLKKYNYEYKEQVVFDGLLGTGGKNLSYDFATYEDGKLDALIECQGTQHFEPVDYFGGEERYRIQLEHDRLKRDFCQRNHILLIEIPYTYSDEEIEAIFSR